MLKRRRRIKIDSGLLQFEDETTIDGRIPPVNVPPVVIPPVVARPPAASVQDNWSIEEPRISKQSFRKKRAAKKEPVQQQPTTDQKQVAEGDESLEENLLAILQKKKTPFLISLVTHVTVLVVLALIPIITQLTTHLTIVDNPEPDFDVHNIAFNDDINLMIGANSVGTIDMALSTAPVLADVSEFVDIPPTLSTMETPAALPKISENVRQAVGLKQSNQVVRGMTGFGVTGTEGAVDRITYEIIKSIEERPTLVVWMFDASVSLSQRRKEIVDRFDKVYHEIGLVTEQQAKQGINYKVAPLLTSIYSFGENIKKQTGEPTTDLDKIKSAVNGIKIDQSGIEMVFSAITMAANEFHPLRVPQDNPQRNVMIIVVTDERGNDIQQMDRAIELCRHHKMPVYILGVPAPFGRTFTYMKYVSPDAKEGQMPGWGQIDQGPETLEPECVRFEYKNNMFESAAIDSGFGSYSLARICYETGGIFFTIHPNRIYDRDIHQQTTAAFAAHLQRFFDPSIMEQYRPDYLSVSDYRQMLDEHPLRSAIVKAAEISQSQVLENPPTRFIKHEAFNFDREIMAAQRYSDQLAKHFEQIADILNRAEPARYSEAVPRWRASYDLSRALANAERIRNDVYNEMLGKVKDMKFQYREDNTWILTPSQDVTGDDKLLKEAHEVLDTFERIIAEHKDTPWAYLAQQELYRGLGWRWSETQVTVTTSRDRRPGGTENPRQFQESPATPRETPVPKL
jgi:hypothetical protein